MQQNNEEYLLQLLYYIHTEILQAEQVDKILWNENFQEWKTLINQEYDVKILGLYGTQETVCEYLSKRLQCTITLSDEAKQYQNRAMICFVKIKNYFYIAFIGLEEYFKKDYFQESIEVTLFRYLKDLCIQIILLPSQSILDGWKCLDVVNNIENTSILKRIKLKNIFQQLMLDVEYEKINWSDCSVEVKEILQKIIPNIREQIQRKMKKNI